MDLYDVAEVEKLNKELNNFPALHFLLLFDEKLAWKTTHLLRANSAHIFLWKLPNCKKKKAEPITFCWNSHKPPTRKWADVIITQSELAFNTEPF